MRPFPRSLFCKPLAAIVALAACTTSFAQPANDACPDAAPLTPGVSVNGTTLGAALDLPVTCHDDTADVWYAFTPAETAPFLITAHGTSNPDLTVAVISGCEFPIGEFGCAVGSSDAGPRLEMLLFEGGPVLIRVGSSQPQDFTVSIGPLPLPANDDCAGATPLDLGAPISTNNLAATTTIEIPAAELCSSIAPGIAGGADTFFSFTPQADGFFDFSTCGSEIDTVVSIHSGCPVSGANAIACNDNAPLPRCDGFDSFSSYVSGVPLTAGTTYYVRVASVLIYNPFTGELEGPGRGRFNILVQQGFPVPVPPNDLCDNAEILGPDSFIAGTTINATGVNPSGTCGDDDVWGVWYAFASTGADRRAFQFTVSPGSFNAAATLTAYSACGGEPIACQASNPFTNPDMTLWAVLDPGESIRLRIAGQGGTQDDFTLLTLTGEPGSLNDTCETAAPLAAGETVTVDTNGAGTATPTPCGNSDNAPLWYAFTPPAQGYYRLATDFFAGGFDRTTLAVYETCAGDPVVCTNQGDGNSNNPAAAATSLFIEQGQTVFIRVSYESPTRGTFTLTAEGPLPPPPPVANDTCDTAAIISAEPFHAEVDVTLATPDQDICVFEGQPLRPTPGGIWYRYTPDVDRVVRATASTLGGEFEAVATVFTGECDAKGGLTQVRCAFGDRPGDPGTPLTAGTTYHILVSLLPPRGQQGDIDEIPYGTVIVLDLIAPPVPANDHCETAQRITSGEIDFSVNTLPADADAPDPSCVGFDGMLQNAVWYTFTPRTAGTLTVHGEGAIPTEGLYSPAGVVYTGTCGDLTEVACDSPADGFFLTRMFTVTADLQPGQTYYLAIGSWNAPIGGETAVTFAYTGDLSCAADFDGDGEVNSNDYFAFLTAFFGDGGADYNGDGQTNSDDYFAFLQAFFTGC